MASASASAATSDAIKVPSNVHYADANDIASNVKREWQINQQLSDYIIESAREKHVATETVAIKNAQTPRRVPVVEISDAVSRGNPFIGQRKSTSVGGTLYQVGAKGAALRGERDSMDGAFGSFTDSFSVLGRTAKALGRDIATWLVKPVDEAHLGDLE